MLITGCAVRPVREAGPSVLRLVWLFLAAGAVLLCWPTSAPSQTATTEADASVASLAGCYEFRIQWRDSKNGPWIERRVWLTTSQLADSANSRIVFVVRPAPGEKASRYTAVYWSPTDGDKGLMIVWTSGLDGVSMHLVLDRRLQRWKGTAQTFSDAIGATSEIGDVVGRAIACQA
jgi:hypothetical protein